MNVLSIDIDYAYSPTISIYDDYVEGSRVTLEEQRSILSGLGMPAPEVNLEKLKILQQVVKEKTTIETPVVIAEHHDQILKFLPDSEPVSIVNFDHHHDVYYPGWHSLDVVDEGNWVYFCGKQNMISYTWVRNEDSEDLPENLDLQFKFEEVVKPNIHDFPVFDLVFACASSHWTGDSGRKHLLEVLGVKR